METPAPGTASEPARQKNGHPWALPVVLLAALALTSTLLAAFREKSPPRADGENASTPVAEGWTPPTTAGQTVALSIDYGNGQRREFGALPWTEGMTVAGALQQARDFHPGIAYTHRGEGAQALLTSLDGVSNDSALGRFWLYEVDGRAGEVSYGVQTIMAGQSVKWTYSGREP